ncbi:MAG: biotin-dependent carboxyltransferase family protein [Acidobacteria bacterium]|nr:biotin-dependent carboxyltransferase family protein [Acidobacteriota bacterium]
MSLTGWLRIVRPGLLTTVQDLGRWSHQLEAVPVAGAMDAYSHRLANHLVGNAPEAATLEVTLIGPELVVDADTVLAVAGADFDLTCGGAAVFSGTAFEARRGAVLRFGRRHLGARAYLAVAGGGILTPPVLGSRATHTVSHMGGLEGRALAAGDALPVAAVASGPANRARGLTLPTGGRARLRVMPGPQEDWFGPRAWQALTSVSFRISPRSNRMGYRLEGPPLEHARSGEPISEPVTMGAIQVPAAGAPILLMADRQTAGGYPKIGHVITADLCLAAQLAPGEFIEFDRCSYREAVAALIARERELMAQMTHPREGGAAR